MPRFVDVPRIVQPQEWADVNYANPLASGLLSYWIGSGVGDWVETNAPVAEVSIAGLARRFAAASSQYISRPSRVRGLPLTIGAIARRASASSTQGIAGIGAATDSRFELYFTTSAAAIQSRNASGTGAISASTVTSTSAFYTLVGVCHSTTSRSIYVNGTGKVTDTGASAPDPCTTEVIGAFYSSGTPSLYLDGSIALVCIWNRALSDDEVAEWSANPWGVFTDERVYRYVAPVSSGFKSAWTVNANSVLQGSLAA